MRRALSFATTWVCISALWCAGCSASESDRAGAGEEAIEIEFWYSSGTPEMMEPLFEEFERQHRGVRIRGRLVPHGSVEQQLIMALASGLPPDVCELGNTQVPRLSHANVLLDLTERSAPLREEYLMWGPGMMEGHVYALPWMVGARMLFVNDDLMRDAAPLLADENLRNAISKGGFVPETWEELLKTCKAIDALGDDVRGFGLQVNHPFAPWHRFMPFALANNAEILPEDMSAVNLTSRPVIETLELFAELREHSMIDNSQEIDHAFARGELGMQIGGPWLFRSLPARYPDLNYSVGLIPRPDHPGGRHASYLGGQMIVVFARTPHPELSYQLAEFIVSAEATTEIVERVRNVLPAALAAFEIELFADERHADVFRQQVLLGVPPPNHPRWSAIERLLSQMIEELLLYRPANLFELARRYELAVNLKLSE